VTLVLNQADAEAPGELTLPDRSLPREVTEGNAENVGKNPTASFSLRHSSVGVGKTLSFLSRWV